MSRSPRPCTAGWIATHSADLVERLDLAAARRTRIHTLSSRPRRAGDSAEHRQHRPFVRRHRHSTALGRALGLQHRRARRPSRWLGLLAPRPASHTRRLAAGSRATVGCSNANLDVYRKEFPQPLRRAFRPRRRAGFRKRERRVTGRTHPTGTRAVRSDTNGRSGALAQPR